MQPASGHSEPACAPAGPIQHHMLPFDISTHSHVHALCMCTCVCVRIVPFIRKRCTHARNAHPQPVSVAPAAATMSKLFHECALHIDTEDAVPHVGRACAAVSATAAAARRRNRHRPATTTATATAAAATATAAAATRPLQPPRHSPQRTGVDVGCMRAHACMGLCSPWYLRAGV